ncbi:discoidin domain-containing protein [Acetivibrio cellulolyticus]|uniref:discoidin domain-containing protein n=1 Tax=Acetivibrio cellulolyticus TaxID=35830 RepID=UPI0001E2C21F|nr:discoidin domain-containing protein [Acetivibrio cellulolyticus]
MKKVISSILSLSLLISMLPSTTLSATKIGSETKVFEKSQLYDCTLGAKYDEESEDLINEKVKESSKEVIKPNALAIERINKERQSKGLSKLVESAIAGSTSTLTNTAFRSQDVTTNSLSSTYSVSPKYVDNSKLKYFPPIMVAGLHNTCVSSASCYYQYTYMMAMAKNLDVRNDPENKLKFSPKWIYNLLNKGENDGIHPIDAYNKMQSVGCLTLNDYPFNPYKPEYMAVSQKSSDYIKALNNRISDWKVEIIGADEKEYTPITSPEDTDLQQIKSRLINGEILTFNTNSIFNYEFRKIKNNTNSSNDDSFVDKFAASYGTGTSPGGHVMTIVGFNDDVWTDINENGIKDNGELGVFIIANNAGLSPGYYQKYHYEGFLYIAYDAINEVSSIPGFQTGVKRFNCMGRMDEDSNDNRTRFYSITVNTDSSPKIVAEVNVTSKLRNAGFEFAVTDSSETNTPKGFNYVNILPANDDCFRSYDGTFDESSATFAFDLTELVGDITNKKVWLRISDLNSVDFLPTVLNDFQIVDLETGATAQNLDIKGYGDGYLRMMPKGPMSTVTSISCNDLADNSNLIISDKTNDTNLPFYFTNYNAMEFTGATVKSPSKTISIPDTKINKEHAYRMIKGQVDFKDFNYEAGNYTVTMNFLNYRGYPITYSKTVYCNPKVPDKGNLAYNKRVNAKDTVNSIETPEKAVNGTCRNLSDKWCSGFGKGADSWLSVDLGEVKKINRWLVIHQSGAGFGYSNLFTRDFKLEASYDKITWRKIDIVSNNTQGITNRYLPNHIEARYLRLYIVNPDIDGAARICEFQLYYDAPQSSSENLTLNKPANASVEDWGYNGNQESPAKAVNGTWNNWGDKWCSGPDKGNNSWLNVDLGNIYKIQRLKVVHERGAGFPETKQYYTRSFTLKYSPDGINDWKTIKNVVLDGDTTTGITHINLQMGIEARYVQLYIDQADYDNIARIYEFQLYSDEINCLDQLY